jgi:LysM repeat protein
MNYFRGITSVFLFMAVLSLWTFPVELAAEDSIHVVVKGETVYSISRTYGVNPGELMKYNNIVDASKLQPGKQLRIPPSTAAGGNARSAAVKPPSSVEYRIVKGDTLYSIARAHGVSLQTILDLNSFSQNQVIKVGDKIKVPAAAVAAQSGTSTAVSRPAQTGQTPEPRQTEQKAIDNTLRWPVAAKEIAYMKGKLYGVVVQGERFESVKSLTQGTVISAGPYRGFGRVAIVQVNGGYLYVYGGCESLSVKEGDKIGPGTELGKLGIDAVSEKPQLFFMVYRSNVPIDPAKAPRA